MNLLTIGKLAAAAGVSTDTVRFYERSGLLPPPARTEANYRLYPQQTVKRLKFIRRAKALGFTLNEIRELLALRHDPDSTKAEVKSFTENKIEDIRQRIADLQRILATLEHLAGACDGHGPADDCPILAAMDDDLRGECQLAGHHARCRPAGG
ncbi:MAG: heavy metal-responsive transcriptional regulator [Deltaproteobacteria bacterium]|nr:heavy metal-responsive transcriptional regulator [Deltaproteobacteria bacterium]